LEYEREFAKKTRDKFSMGVTSSESYSGPAGPASGQDQKYGGFGSADINRMGYNNSEQFGSSVYDPYTKSEKEKEEEKKKKEK
jgi:hypothetical protein